MELYKKHRPTKLNQIVGNKEAVAYFKAAIKKKDIPRAILFTGPSGCGKTTFARILKDKVECSDSDFKEINCADFNGIDTVRAIRREMGLAPIGGKSRMWLIDEAHELTKPAQNSFLKILEDTPRHCYFVLATTEEGKLLRTTLTRLTEVRLKSLDPTEMKELLESIALAESFDLHESVCDKLIALSDGSPRKALVLMNQILDIPKEDDQLELIGENKTSVKAIDLAISMIYRSPKWGDVAKMLNGIDMSNPEQLRHMMLTVATNELLKARKGSARASLIITAFEGNFYDSKRAGFVNACFDVVSQK